MMVTTLLLSLCLAAQPAKAGTAYIDRFDQGMKNWQMSDPQAWKILRVGGDHILSQFKASKVRTPHRSPFNIALVKEPTFTDFALDVDVRSTTADYPHRDACLFFGYQDPAHFYYVHLAKKADDFANQVFIVNAADRKKISRTTNAGTAWDDAWHHLRLVRQVKEGTVEVYFDDMKTPIMTARDRTFGTGRVGVGSFDDTADWKNLEVRALPKAAEEPR